MGFRDAEKNKKQLEIMKIQLVVPMSGIGKRFKDAGYNTPKPLIKVRGKEIINHVVNMFGKIERVIFICNEEHLNNESLNLFKRLENLHQRTPFVFGSKEEVETIKKFYEDPKSAHAPLFRTRGLFNR